MYIYNKKTKTLKFLYIFEPIAVTVAHTAPL